MKKFTNPLIRYYTFILTNGVVPVKFVPTEVMLYLKKV